MSYARQTELMADFFDRYLRGNPAAPPAKSIRYYVNGAGRWRTSATWPPPGTRTHRWYLGGSATLSASPPQSPGVDRYRVDFSASTGALSGYRGQVDLSRTNYGNRAVEDRKLLVYSSAPLEADLEITGDPLAHVRLASSRTDGLLIMYLEDAAPDGRVTYITQGVLRLAFRKLAAGDDSAYSADPLHTYRRADLRPMKPGAFEEVSLGLSPLAALVRKGHRLRVAIAAADDGNLERLPAEGEATLSVARSRDSYVEVPQL